MKLTLKLRYRTTFGQNIRVTGEHPLLGAGLIENAIPLAYLNDEFWQVTLSFPVNSAIPPEGIRYQYVLSQPDGTLLTDEGRGQTLAPALFTENEVLVVDTWNAAGFPENTFYTEPFRKVLLKERQTEYHTTAPVAFTHTFKVRAPLLTHRQTLCLLGSAEALGRWETHDPILLNRLPGEAFLSVDVNLTGEAFPIEYKYGVFDLERRFLVDYEGGSNRILHEPPLPNRHVVCHDGFAVLPFNTWKGAGVAIPVFSLRSESGYGVGEFPDLKRLVDWCAKTGLKVIQMLPVNDTTAHHSWEDSYPYAAISAFALNPLYLNLEAASSVRNKTLLKELEAERQRLNALPALDYPAVMRAKLSFLKRIFPTQKVATFRSKDYKSFFADNQHWLAPYAVFSFLRDRYGTPDSSRWPEHQRCIPAEIEAMTASDFPEHDAVAFHCFVQYHLHRQLQDAAQYAHAHGVILKGDIAIGVSRNGSDTWQQPELYHLNLQAGAPPDPFSTTGQNWGFPTYNWPRMMQDGFAWWKQRFGQMHDYFDAFRVDHILGFFRIWSIPDHAIQGVLGCFVPAIPVASSEFTGRGIQFNHARYLEPFITDAVLSKCFGPEADTVKGQFLISTTPGRYALRPEFATQRQVEQHFATLDPTEATQKLKAGLFDLISNVILLEVKGANGPELHFRFHMEKTTSFLALDARTQTQLRELYVDYFFRRQDDFWRQEALQKLPALKRVTNLLICGEDLGLVPACVPDVMRDLGLLSLEIQRMPKQAGRRFSRPSEAPYLSVVSPSTHDMSTIRGWWTEDAALTQRFFNEELGLSGSAPEQCSGCLNEAVVTQHLASPAMWSIFQLQDLLGMDETLRNEDPDSERINVPANPKHLWRYRMHLTLETLLKAETFNQHLHDLVHQHGR